MPDPCAKTFEIPEGYLILKAKGHLGWSIFEGRHFIADGFKSENQAKTWLDGYVTGLAIT